jgi:hypothetical protein
MYTDVDSSNNDPDLYRLVMHVTSNPDLPFVDIDEYNETIVNKNELTSVQYHARHKNGHMILEIMSRYEQEKKQSFYSCKNQTDSVYEVFNHLNSIPPYYDGPSLFYYTRTQIRSNKILQLPTMILGKIEKTVLDFNQSKELIKVKALDQPVWCQKYKGYADWHGATSADLSGEFCGWITMDEAAIPLRAQVKVLLGSLVIELEKYERPDSNPGQVNNNLSSLN